MTQSRDDFYMEQAEYAIQRTLSLLKDVTPSRSLSMVLTKLDEASLWLERARREHQDKDTPT